MKVIKFFIYSFVLITTFSVSAISQAVSSPIIVINTNAFKDKQNGIKEVVEAYDKLEIEFKPQNDELNLITEKARKLSKEINEIAAIRKDAPKGICFAPLDNVIEEFTNLNIAYKKKDERKKILYDKRKSEIFAEIDKKILDALKQFAKENKFEVILDIAKLDEEPSPASIGDDLLDVTQKFIEFYNRNFSLNNQK